MYKSNSTCEAPVICAFAKEELFLNNNTEGQQNNTSTAAPSFKSDESRRANKAKIEAMAAQISTLFVRKDNKFFAVDNLNVRLSKDDVERACINLFASMEGDDLNLEVLKGALNLAIVQKAVNPRFTIPVWNGQVVCAAGNNERLVRKKGMVAVNVWIKPSYRDRNVPADFGVATEFLEWIFPVPAERTKILDWVAWNLQNESDKPSWAPLLYSEEKGTGKSTFCELIAALMGKENSVTQNNVKKLAARFNMTALQSKLVISEELQLRSDGAEANALKTYLTEGDALAERKGQEAVRITQCCAFLFTTNHLPTWIEAGDRRFYVVEVKHDGHASGCSPKRSGRLCRG